MNTLEQVKENIKIANKMSPNSLSDEDLQVIDRIKNLYHEKLKIRCTAL
ncbi:hypothetical protein [Natranaerobius trueperi]|nr:hypothetical protein [Natranaerobius trueperi]